MWKNMLALAALSLIVGCGPSNPPTAKVSGTVTLDGNPVEGATVLFIPDDAENKPATAQSQADGTYALTTFEFGDGAMPGNYKIKVHKYDTPDGGYSPYGDSPEEAAPEEPKEMTQEEMDAMIAASYSEDLEAATKQREQKAKNELPEKYADQNSSGLTYMVTEAGGTFDIELKSK